MTGTDFELVEFTASEIVVRHIPFGHEFIFDIIGDGGQVVDPGDWVVRMAGGMYLVLEQDAFDAIFQSVAGPAPITLSIQESR